MKIHPEEHEQLEVVKYLRRCGVDPIFVKNERKATPATRALLRALGLRPGCSDLLILDRVPARPDLRWLGVEMKAENGTESGDQAAFRRWAPSVGGLVRCFHGSADAIAWLASLGFTPPT